MPIYEYRCNACEHQFEINQRMTDDPVRECEVCGGEVRRVLYAPAIHFKGTGFHNTDYGTRKRPKESEAATSGASTDGSGPASKDGASGGGEAGGAKKVREATPAATAARTTGP